ncbi:MAG: SDR family oxidoreductase [Pseudomonadota bacterium]|nr:SDR family oxidoreductase [Pseudomonadota bacterium]
MEKLEGKTAIVTGAAQGIGAAYARALANEGAQVAVVDVLECDSAVQRIAKDLPDAEIAAFKCDISNEKATLRLVDQVVARFGGLHILINNAAVFGTLQPQPFDQIDMDLWDRVQAVNVRGMLLMCRAVVRVFRDQKYGKIINIGSDTILKGVPFMSHYVTSKGGVFALTRVLARELGDDNICVNTLAPGLTMSEAVIDWGPEGDHDKSLVIASRSIKREQVPQDLTGTMIFLSSPESDFMTGQYIAVNGGDCFS